MRKTKIICTLGPASDNEHIIEQLFKNGMNGARLNFSHGSHEEHYKRIEMFKNIRRRLNLPVPLILDTKGPEIRIGKFKHNKITLEKGDCFMLTADDIIGDEKACSFSYKDLYKHVKKDDKILINDGLVELIVDKIINSNIYCKVVNGGALYDRKSMHVPGACIKLPSLTHQDVEDIKFGIENEFDYIAISFVRTVSDILEVRKLLENNGGNGIKIIAKVESQEGINNFDEILHSADGIMIARGDLGVEISAEEVPILQKNIIQKCYTAGKPVITATHMLESMIWNSRPTRAEVSDVANAVYDSSSSVMLSGETASGKHPVESLKTMARILERAEASIDYRQRFNSVDYNMLPNVTNAISHATCTTANDLNASAIITVTKTGYTAGMISRFRPFCPIIACTMCERVQRQLSLSWGVFPILMTKKQTTDEIFDSAVKEAQSTGIIKSGDLVVITAGVPVNESGTTNILKAQLIK